MDVIEPSDEALLRGAASGSEESWTRLYRRHQGRVYRFALHLSGSAAVAEEATQETFLALLTDFRRFNPERGSLAAFLIGVARNKVKALAGEEPPWMDAAAQIEPAAAPTVVADLTQRADEEELRAAIAALPLVYREALVLCELEEMDYEAAAAALGCPVGTLKSRLHRAKALLQERMVGHRTRKGCLT